MKAYKVSCQTTEQVDEEEVTKTHVQYAGTQADARATRDAMVEKHHVNKRRVEIEDAEIPVAKPELLKFINGLLES